MRLATPTMRNIYVLASRNGDSRNDPVSCMGCDMNTVWSLTALTDFLANQLIQLMLSCSRLLGMHTVRKLYDDDGKLVTDFGVLKPKQHVWASAGESWVVPVEQVLKVWWALHCSNV